MWYQLPHLGLLAVAQQLECRSVYSQEQKVLSVSARVLCPKPIVMLSQTGI